MEVSLFLAICSFVVLKCSYQMHYLSLGTQLRFCFETWIRMQSKSLSSVEQLVTFIPEMPEKTLFWKHIAQKCWTQFQNSKHFLGYTQRGFGSMWKLIKRDSLTEVHCVHFIIYRDKKTGLLSRKARISYKLLAQGSTNFSVRDQKINIWSFCGLYVLCWNYTTLVIV